MKILTLNIRVWTRDARRKESGAHWWVARYRAIHDYIEGANPDIICLQEVWFPAALVLCLRRLGYKRTGWGFSHPIYVRRDVPVSGRRVSVYVTAATLKDDDLQVFSVHAHWCEKRFSKAMAWILKQRDRSVDALAAGDFNTSSVAEIGEALNDELTSSREALGLTAVDTFANYKCPTRSHGEIDHIFASGGVKPLVYIVGGTDSLSDHRPVTLTFV